MLGDWALDILLRTERPGTIGHMIGRFLYHEPALGLKANEIIEGIRSLCFLTRAMKATAGYGEEPATRFLSVDRTREHYFLWRAYARWQAYVDTLPRYDWVSSSGDSCSSDSSGVSSGDDWGAAVAAELAAKRRNWRMRSGRAGTAEAHRAMHPSGRHESVAGPNEAASACRSAVSDSSSDR